MLACPECRALFPDGTAECPEHGKTLVAIEALPAADPPLAPGTMVGEYRVDRKLGSGSFGDVYAGEQPLIGKRVAIKVLNRKFSSDAGVVSRFISEARAVNRIRHRNIIDIFSFGLFDENRHYFVMELLDGLTLGELLARERRLTLPVAIPIIRGIADALDAAHEAGVTHRDLKPDNVFLASEKGGGYFPKLLDFGIAKLVSDEMAHKTATGAALGTPRYMSPEQCRGKSVDHRADVYSLGAVIHEMLTGRPIFEGESTVDVMFKHTSEPPLPMSRVCADLPPELDAPVLAMLAKRPSARPSSAGKAVAPLIERAADNMEAPTVQGSSEKRVSPSVARALARIEDATLIEGRVAPPGPPHGALTTTGTSKPAAGDRAEEPEPSSRTVPAAPVTAAVLAPELPRAAVAATADNPGATLQSPPLRELVTASEHSSAPKGGIKWMWPVAAGAGLLLAAIAVLRSGASTAPAAGPAADQAGAAAGAARADANEAREVKVRLDVTPPDADVMLDDRRVASAKEPLVLPRSDRRHAVRITKDGFEAQTLWVLPDRDQTLPPIVLVAITPVVTPALAPASASAAPRATGSARAQKRLKPEGDLERPSEFGHPK